MSESLSDRSAAVERHLGRVEDKLPADVSDFCPMTDAYDSVVLHLWLAIQGAMDLAVQAGADLGRDARRDYQGAIQALVARGIIDRELATGLKRALGFVEFVGGGYPFENAAWIYREAAKVPADLRRFLDAVRNVGP